MTDKEFHKLGRRELLQLLLAQAKEADELRAQLTETTEQLSQLEENYERLRKRLDQKDEQIHKLRDSLQAEKKKREIELADAGSIAEASLRLNGIFEAAQRAADQYLHNVKMLQGSQLNGYLDHEPVLTRTVSLAQDQTRNVMQVSQETVLKRVVNLSQRQETIVDAPMPEPKAIADVPEPEVIADVSVPEPKADVSVLEPESKMITGEATREMSENQTVIPQEPLRNTADLPKQPVKKVVDLPQKPVKNLVNAVKAETAGRMTPPSINTGSEPVRAAALTEPEPMQTVAQETQRKAQTQPDTAEVETRVVEVVEVRLNPQERTGKPYWPEVEEEPTIPEWADNVPKSKVPLARDKVKLSRTLPAGRQARIRNFRLR